MGLKKNVVICILIISVLVASTAALAETQNRRSFGLFLGDPMTLSLAMPVKDNTFFNVHAGMWSWHFWHDKVEYETPFLSIDYAWRTPIKEIPFFSYIGAGAAVFFGDNPKDEKNYDACAAVRVPFGFTFYSNKDFTLGFEIAPIYQFLPPYHAGPYGLELNGGLTLMFPF